MSVIKTKRVVARTTQGNEERSNPPDWSGSRGHNHDLCLPGMQVAEQEPGQLRGNDPG